MPARSRSLLAAERPDRLAGDGAGLLGLARGGQALLIEEEADTPALAAARARSSRTASRVRRRALRGRRHARVRHRAGGVSDRPGPQRVRPGRPARRAGPGGGRRRRGRRCRARAPRRGRLLLHEPLAARIAERELRPADGGHRAAARPGAVRDGARRRRDRLGAMGEIAARVSEQVEALELQAYELAGGPFVLGSPKQLGEVLFERLQLPAGRRGKTGYSTDSKVLAKVRDLHPIVAGRRGVARALEAALDLPAAVPRAARRGRPPAHDVLAGHGRHRPAVGAAPEPAEHPDPHAARARAARDVRGRAGPSAAVGRLLAGRAAHPRPPLGEELLREAFERGEDIHARHGRRGARQGAEELSKDERNRAKAVNFGIIYGISAHGLSEQLEITRDEAQALHRHLSRPDAARGRVHRARDPATRASAATPSRCSAAAGRSPSCARRAGTSARSASAWPSTP